LRVSQAEVEAPGIETGATSAPDVADSRENPAKDAMRGDARRPEVSASGDVVEAALAKAIDAEVEERRPGWEARVALLAGELQARRLARAGVAVFDAKRRQGHG
jgi:hypothetical protein